MTLTQLLARFPDEETCREHLFKLRWPGGKVTCPRCGDGEKIYRRGGKATSYRWICKACNKNGYGFGLCTGTVFEDTKIGLDKWFQVLLLMLTAKKGMSALQIQRTVFGQARTHTGKITGKGSYETTWYMCHRLRAAMKDNDFLRLMGEVEVDETYVGGKAKNRHGGGPGGKRRNRPGHGGVADKTPVIGAISRKGNVVCQVIERTDRKTLEGFVREAVADRVSLVATDEHAGYTKLSAAGYPHEAVSHHSGEYVRGKVHTGNIDSFWSLLKRGIMGSFHHVSKDYLPLYLNEFSFRHNQRDIWNAVTFDRVLESC